MKPVFQGNVKECGEIQVFDPKWYACSGKKPKNLKPYTGYTPNESIYDDPIMSQLIEDQAAEIFTTDECAAAMMSCVKSNYSWDVEIKIFGGTTFIDKR